MALSVRRVGPCLGNDGREGGVSWSLPSKRGVGICVHEEADCEHGRHHPWPSESGQMVACG